MKITSEWWKKPDAELPFDRDGFDLDDTLKDILDRNPIAATMVSFNDLLARLVPDEVLRKSIVNNIANSLKFVTDDIRREVARVLFAMKNPHRAHDSGRVGPRVVDPLAVVKGHNEQTDKAVERIAGESTRSLSAKDLPVTSAQLDEILGDDKDDVPAVKAPGTEVKRVTFSDTREVNSNALHEHLKRLREEKEKEEGGKI